MANHTLTRHQWVEVFNAFDIDKIRGIVIKLGNPEKTETFSTREVLDNFQRLGVSFDTPPKITKDPRVNFVIDCIFEFECEENEPVYDESLYQEEILNAQNEGLL